MENGWRPTSKIFSNVINSYVIIFSKPSELTREALKSPKYSKFVEGVKLESLECKQYLSFICS